MLIEFRSSDGLLDVVKSITDAVEDSGQWYDVFDSAMVYFNPHCYPWDYNIEYRGITHEFESKGLDYYVNKL